MASASVDRRPSGKYRARWRELDGTQRAKHFDSELEAEQHLITVQADMLRGTYLDPARGKVTFGVFAEAWRKAQVHQESTAIRTETMIRLHMAVWSHRPLGSIRPSEVQAWVKGLSVDQDEPKRKALAPSYVAGIAHLFSTIMSAAVIDKMIIESPVVNLSLPVVDEERIVPLEPPVVLAIAEHIRDELGVAVLTSAMSGLRISEVTGLTVDRVDFVGREIVVDQQVWWPPHRGWEFKRPKTKASRRVIPMPERLSIELARHIEQYELGDSGLIFHSATGAPWRRGLVQDALNKAVLAVGAPEGTTWHDFRHFYASVLIRGGASVKVVQARLGHAKASETLDTYAHLWPAEDDETRLVIDGVFGTVEDRLRTKPRSIG
jgi:integrase